jgi:hypothetical protein
MTYLSLFLRALNFLVWLAVRFRDGQLREEGRSEVLQQIERRNAAQTEAVKAILEDHARVPLDELERRMRAYERTTTH